MSEQLHAPIPTEYKGVRFRSKSEAIFARALELRGYEIWEYEPRGFEVADWCPDFWCIGISPSKIISSLLIEYKPSEPTDSYKEYLADNFKDLGEKTHRHLILLACGNSFSEERKTFYLDTKESRWVSTEHKAGLFKHIKEASRFRFDLK